MGANVALVEANRVGGDCTWTGCVPSKSLIKVAKVAHSARMAGKYGVLGIGAPADIKVDMKCAKEYVQGRIAVVYERETPQRLEEKGVRVFLGRASFVDAHHVKVTPTGMPDNPLSEESVIYAERIVICTGAAANVPSFLRGQSEVPFWTYESIFDVDTLPSSMLVVGGGPIGSEIAQAYQRLGCQVTMVTSRLLPKEDTDTHEVIAQVFAKEGIRICTSRASAARLVNGQVHLNTVDGTTLVADKLFIAVGRHPVFEDLNLGAAGVHATLAGIQTNKYLQTNVKHIYAAGRCRRSV